MANRKPWQLHIVRDGIENWVQCEFGLVSDAIRYFTAKGWKVLDWRLL